MDLFSKKIDMHVHALPERDLPKLNGHYYVLPNELRAIYDRYGIEKGVLLCFGGSPECSTDRLSMREARNLVKKYPDTIGWWFCAVDPRAGKNSKETDFLHFLNYYKEKGARGLGEVTCNLRLDDPRMMSLFSACEQVGFPVTLHFGKQEKDMGVIDAIHLPLLENILKTFPKMQVIGHSARFWSELGDDVTEETRSSFLAGKIQREGVVARLLRRYNNLTCDLSSVSGYMAMVRDPEYTCGFLEEFNNRLYFATDISEKEHGQSEMMQLSHFLDQLMLEGKITEKAYRNICRENALKLLEKEIL